MQINKFHKFYGNDFINIFKSITFDNGNEFARWKDMEKKPRTKKRQQILITKSTIRKGIYLDNFLKNKYFQKNQLKLVLAKIRFSMKTRTFSYYFRFLIAI